MWIKEEPRTENDLESFTPLVPEMSQDFSDQFLVEDFRSKIAKSQKKMKYRNAHKEFESLNLHIKITQTVTIQLTV